MRLSVVLLTASSGLVDARWVQLAGHRNLVGRGSFPPPRETGHMTADGIKGWTPKPTPAPGSVSESDAVLELLKEKRAAKSSNTWEDDTTCGWTSGVSSEPLTCAPGSSCRTNNENVVGCVSGTYSPFFTVCLDMQAFQQGACASIGPQTGCCQSSGFGACGTLLWTGNPPRSMYRCFPKPTIISMNDEPQEVIDASTSTTSTSTTSSSSTTSSAAAQTSAGDDDDDDEPSSNGEIVGGVVGGVAVLALLAGIVTWIIVRGKRAGKNNQTYNAVTPSDSGKPHGAQQMAQQQYSGGYTTIPGGATAFPPASPYPASTSTATAYDPRQSYYDPSKPPPHSPGQASQTGYPVAPTPPAQQHLYAGQTQPPASPPAQTSTYNPHHSVMSELDSSALAGTHGNPVEMGSNR